jgi:hypothetical protein
MELVQSGDLDGANELRDQFRSQFRDENNLRPWSMGLGGKGHKFGKMGEMEEVLESGDYEAWVELMNNRPNFVDHVSEDTFQKMTEIHELMESGDEEAARELREQFIKDLGLENIVQSERGFGGGSGFRHMER